MCFRLPSTGQDVRGTESLAKKRLAMVKCAQVEDQEPGEDNLQAAQPKRDRRRVIGCALCNRMGVATSREGICYCFR